MLEFGISCCTKHLWNFIEKKVVQTLSNLSDRRYILSCWPVTIFILTDAIFFRIDLLYTVTQKLFHLVIVNPFGQWELFEVPNGENQFTTNLAFIHNYDITIHILFSDSSQARRHRPLDRHLDISWCLSQVTVVHLH